jgi:hypothetical protein
MKKIPPIESKFPTKNQKPVLNTEPRTERVEMRISPKEFELLKRVAGRMFPSNRDARGDFTNTMVLLFFREDKRQQRKLEAAERREIELEKADF